MKIKLHAVQTTHVHSTLEVSEEFLRRYTKYKEYLDRDSLVLEERVFVQDVHKELLSMASFDHRGSDVYAGYNMQEFTLEG